MDHKTILALAQTREKIGMDAKSSGDFTQKERSWNLNKIGWIIDFFHLIPSGSPNCPVPHPTYYSAAQGFEKGIEFCGVDPKQNLGIYHILLSKRFAVVYHITGECIPI